VVVIISSDGVNQSRRPWLLGAPLADRDPGDILAVPVEGHGWVSAGNLSRYYRGWLREHIGTLDGQALDELDSALRAALEL
jgi:mRNA interferase MazF